MHNPHIQSYCPRGFPQGLASNSEEGKIYSSPPEVISDAMLFVYPLRDASPKMYARVTRYDAKIPRLAISMEPTPLPEKVSSYGLLPRLCWLGLQSHYYENK